MDENRRKLLYGAGLLSIAGAALSLPSLSFAKTTNPNATKLEVFGVGDIPVAADVPLPIVSPGPPPSQLFTLLPYLLADYIKIRVTQQLAENLFTATVQIVAGSQTPPQPLPLPPLPLTISDFDTAIEAVTLGNNPTNTRYNFAAMGRVTNVRTPSPFGELVGRAAAYSGEFDSTGDTNLYFFGGFVAGSHSTWVPLATGSVQVNPASSFLG